MPIFCRLTQMLLEDCSQDETRDTVQSIVRSSFRIRVWEFQPYSVVQSGHLCYSAPISSARGQRPPVLQRHGKGGTTSRGVPFIILLLFFSVFEFHCSTHVIWFSHKKRGGGMFAPQLDPRKTSTSHKSFPNIGEVQAAGCGVESFRPERGG
jgi:hypothetical protein